jgi:hypothetical protein
MAVPNLCAGSNREVVYLNQTRTGNKSQDDADSHE